jgi:hypothetical protein
MQMSESVALLRALKEIDRGTRRIIKVLSEALAVNAKTQSKPAKHSTVMRTRLKL